jgi:hypothetical protein
MHELSCQAIREYVHPLQLTLRSCSISVAKNVGGAWYDICIIRFAYKSMSKGMDRKKEVKKPKKDKKK